MQCKYGIDRKNCRKANAALSRLGVKPLRCGSCDIDPAADAALAKWSDAKAKHWVRAWVRAMGFDVSLLEAATSPSGFRCPIINENIVLPCGLMACRYHIDYPWSSNCLLAYMNQQEIEVLSADEVAYLYSKPVDDVKNLLEQATTILRSKALDTDAVDNSSLARQFRYFVTDRVCCVCESAVDPQEIPKSLRIESIGAVYCSKECKDEKAARLVELEIEKGLPIGRILDWTFRRYKSLALAEQALGIPRWLAYDACKKFLDRPIEGYFSSLKTIHGHRRSALIRRTWHAPQWVNSMLERLRPVFRTVVDHFGPPTLQANDIQQTLNHAIQNL